MPEETKDAVALLHVTERLMKEFPGLDPRVVRDAVDTAYADLQYVRVRTYLPVLMERRAHDLLSAADQGSA
ncbi:three-helix bundle dimerization domain-containing protein [Streptomyces sp. NPDC056169]|uniref:three-helix bundle dimerization domain-containing protein n=1 Tax=Streptomyces sp. NPDC056169 TaxID=3345734 RepID=UPI0035DAF4F2